MAIDKILMQIKDNPTLKWPKPLSSRPKGKNSWKYCRFHEGNGPSRMSWIERENLGTHRGKLQKFIKKDHHLRPKTDDVSSDDQKEEERDHPKPM